MLVIVSDLHLMDTTAGCHNLSVDAFRDVFLSRLAGLIADAEKRIKSVEILLLGDVFDFIRTEKWFEVDPVDRPWGKNGLADISSPRPGGVTEKQCLEILGDPNEQPADPPQNTILHQNWETFQLIRNLENELNDMGERLRKADLAASVGTARAARFEQSWHRVTVKVRYFPGNHDRLLRVYPSVRARAFDILGIKDPAPSRPLPIDYPNDFYEKGGAKDYSYGVYAQHGHELDKLNFGGLGASKDPYLLMPVGDIITTEIGAKIPWMLEKKLSPEEKDIAERIKDIDNVRPLSKIFDWLLFKVRKGELQRVEDKLREALDGVFRDLADIDAFPESLAKAGISGLIESWAWKSIRSLAPGIVSELSVHHELVQTILGIATSRSNPEEDMYARGAFDESKWKAAESPIRYIVYGHTHKPVEVLLDATDGREAYYVNTGTWRARIHESVKFDRQPDFAKLRHMTYAVFYSIDEDIRGKQEGTKSFEVWSATKGKHYKNQNICHEGLA
jgi:UDP-2,3-diacylglucosamine pyrophosphatase LpxH